MLRAQTVWLLSGWQTASDIFKTTEQENTPVLQTKTDNKDRVVEDDTVEPKETAFLKW